MLRFKQLIRAPNAMTATLADVAKKAGVSAKTASRVVNGEDSVRASTREKVEAAVQSLGYRPNLAAKGLASKRTFLISFVCNEEAAASTWATQIHMGILRRCREAGYQGLFYAIPKSIKGHSAMVEDVAQHLWGTRVEGAVLAPPLSDDVVLHKRLQALDIPWAGLNTVKDNPSNMPIIRTDDLKSSRDVMAHLLGLGHRKIAFICAHPDSKDGAFREQGYRSAMRDAGIIIERNWVQQGFNSFASGFEAARTILASTDQRPTAIFAANDDMAAGVISAAHEAGLSLPKELSVVGFDDSVIAEQLWPPLTTVRQPVNQMAETSTELLIERLKTGTNRITGVTMSMDLIIRGSTAEPPKQP